MTPQSLFYTVAKQWNLDFLTSPFLAHFYSLTFFVGHLVVLFWPTKRHISRFLTFPNFEFRPLKHDPTEPIYTIASENAIFRFFDKSYLRPLLFPDFHLWSFCCIIVDNQTPKYQFSNFSQLWDLTSQTWSHGAYFTLLQNSDFSIFWQVGSWSTFIPRASSLVSWYNYSYLPNAILAAL
jgi:hypothetical protein